MGSIIMLIRQAGSRRFKAAIGASTLALAVWQPLSAEAQFAAQEGDVAPDVAACVLGDVLNNVQFYPGSPGNDEVTGTAGNDTHIGGACNDVFFGEQGDDRLVGNRGDDELHGDGNADVVRGGFGNDLADGGIGRDVVFGGPGDDECLGGNGDDLVFGGPGEDIVNGNAGCDICFGDGNDTFLGCEVIVINGVVVQGQFSDCREAPDPVRFAAEEEEADEG